jgi:hypothetical protein
LLQANISLKQQIIFLEAIIEAMSAKSGHAGG